MADQDEKVLIVFDGDNFSYLIKNLSSPIDYKKLLSFLSEGKSLIGSVYFMSVDNSVVVDIRHRRFKYYLRSVGMQVISLNKRIKVDPFSGQEYKAGYEDGTIMHHIFSCLDNFQTLVLVSGDGDFHWLVDILHKKFGKTVVVVASGNNVSEELLSCAQRYIDISHRDVLARIKREFPAQTTSNGEFEESQGEDCG